MSAPPPAAGADPAAGPGAGPGDHAPAGADADAAAGAGPLVAVGWVHVVADRLLAVRTRGRDRFYLPGGKPELGETLVEAVTREVFEELGVVLAGAVPAFVVEDAAHGLHRPRRVRMTCFTGTGTGEPRPAAEIAELAWLGRADRHRAAPAVQQVLDRVLGPGPSPGPGAGAGPGPGAGAGPGAGLGPGFAPAR